MKQKIFLRGLLGFPLGIAIGHMIGIMVSLSWANGRYIPCVPAFMDAMGSELNAVVLQSVLCGLIGATFAACSVVWETEHWSIAKQTGIYFLVTALVMLPAAWLANWMEHSFLGFLSYFGIFTGIFFAVWLAQYLALKKKIRQLNDKVEKRP